MSDRQTLPNAVTPGSLLGGKYRLEHLLGAGGMGTVWAAENVDIGRKVAIKMLHPQYAADPTVLARFRQEARAAAAIGHPGIVDVLDLGQLPSGEAFLVMQYLEGETVGARLQTQGPLDPLFAAWVVGEVLDAIGAAHDRGIIHRDLKPDNVFVAEKPAAGVKILDFGISKFHAEQNTALTRTGVVMGTPSYMAPEQARGARDVGPAADLYAVGAIFYEMLSGSPAFDGQSYNEVIAKILMEEKPPLARIRPDVPEPLRRVVDLLMAKDPAARPGDARTAKAMLLEAIRNCPPAGLTNGPQQPIPLVAVAPPVQTPVGTASAAAVSGPPGPIPLVAVAPPVHASAGTASAAAVSGPPEPVPLVAEAPLPSDARFATRVPAPAAGRSVPSASFSGADSAEISSAPPRSAGGSQRQLATTATVLASDFSGSWVRVILGVFVPIVLATKGGVVAGLSRATSHLFFPAVAGLGAGILCGLLGGIFWRGTRPGVVRASLTSLFATAGYLAAQCLAPDFLKPFVVPGAWFTSVLRGEWREWLFASIEVRTRFAGLAAGDALLVLTLLDAAAFLAAMLLVLHVVCRGERHQPR